jgi:hypothetical protein
MSRRASLRTAPLLALLAGVAGVPSCRRGPEATRFVNFDPESSPSALISGWSGFEKTGLGETFAWAQARDATLRVFAGDPEDRLVRFRVWPFRWQGAPPQTVTLFVNDVRHETLTLADGPQVLSVASPGPAWKDGPNVLTFELGYAEAPKDRIAGAGDSRTLAAAFDWVEVLPATSAPRAK